MKAVCNSLPVLAITFLFLVLSSQVHALGMRPNHGFYYNAATKECSNDVGQKGVNENYIGECGHYQATEEEILGFNLSLRNLPGLSLSGGVLDNQCLQGINLSGLKISKTSIKAGNLREALLTHAELVQVNLMGSDLTASKLEEASFDRVNLTGANLSGCDLRGTEFRNTQLAEVTFMGAIFNERTKLPFSCSEAQSKGMIYQGKDEFYCDSAPPVEFKFSSLFSTKHPGITALLRGDQKTLYLYTADELSISPLKPREMLESQMNHILCAAQLELCIYNPEKLLSRYYLNLLPDPVLKRGIEFYHTSSLDMEYYGQGRAVGYFNVERNPELPPQDSRIISSELRSDVQTEWNTYGSRIQNQESPTIQFRSILTDTVEMRLESQWDRMIETQSDSAIEPGNNCVKNTANGTYSCGINFDLRRSENSAPGWSEQRLNDLIRKAQLQSINIGMKLVPSVRSAFKMNFIQAVPILNLNLTTVLASHFRRL